MNLLYLPMYSIRPATIADTEIIRSIAHGTWWHTYSPILSQEQIAFMLTDIYAADTISRLLETGEQHFLLLIENDRPVAYAAYSPRQENPDIYKLHKLYCLPETQGKGYGKILINAVIEQVKQAGKSVLELNVNRYNKSYTFYLRMGFSIAYEEDVAFGSYWMNDYVMRKELNDNVR